MEKIENSGWYYYLFTKIKNITPAVVSEVRSLNKFKEEYIQIKADKIIKELKNHLEKLLDDIKKTGKVSKCFRYPVFYKSTLDACMKDDFSVSVLILDAISRQMKILKETWKKEIKSK